MPGPAMHHGLHRSYPGAADRPLHGHDGGDLPPQLRGLRRYHRFRQVRKALELTLVLTLPVLFTGPVPRFFSDTPPETLAELKKSPKFAFECLQQLVSRLLERGDLTRYDLEGSTTA